MTLLQHSVLTFWDTVCKDYSQVINYLDGLWPIHPLFCVVVVFVLNICRTNC